MRLIPRLAIQRKICCISATYIGDADTKNPYLSPLFGIIRVPAHAHASWRYEVLLSDTLSVSGSNKKAGVKVRTSVYDGMFHVFQMGL